MGQRGPVFYSLVVVFAGAVCKHLKTPPAVCTDVGAGMMSSLCENGFLVARRKSVVLTEQPKRPASKVCVLFFPTSVTLLLFGK